MRNDTLPGPAPRRSARAFTLVELLVVIGIIALLIGLLLPDGIFFSRSQVRTPDGQLMTDIISRASNPDGPRIIERFDDIVFSGGS